MNKIFPFTVILLFSTTLFAANWNGEISQPRDTILAGDPYSIIDDTTIYILTNAKELAWFASKINAGDTLNAVLANDITIIEDQVSRSNYAWTPIGKTNELAFNGFFDGNRHTISGIYCESDISGLFGVIGTKGVVKNIRTQNGLISSRNGAAGAISAFNYGQIKNVSNSMNIIGYSYSGGITGRNYGSMSKVENNGTVSSIERSFAFDPESYYYDFSQTWYTGGLTAVNNGVIEFGLNTDSVQNSSANPCNNCGIRAGGIAAFNSGTIIYCGNNGPVISNAKQTGGSYVATAYAGGIVAQNDGTIKDSWVGGNVFANASSYTSYKIGFAGGISAANNGSIYNVLVYAPLIKGTGHSVYWGILSGENSTGKVMENLFYDKSIVDTSTLIGNNTGTLANVQGLESEHIKNMDFVNILNTADGKRDNIHLWQQNNLKNDGYPYLNEFVEFHYYSIRFYNADSTLLDSLYQQYGTKVKYDKEVPTKKATSQYTYIFKDWHIGIANVTEDFDYYAIYDSTVNFYTIKFQNYGSTTLQTSSVAYGEIPEYTGATPVQAADATYTYAFNGWTPSITAVTGAATYTATFNATKLSSSSSAGSSSVVSSSSEFSSSSESPTFTGNISVSRFTLSVAGRVLNVQNATANSRYAVMDAQGRVLFQGTTQSKEFTLTLPRSGAYFVRIGAVTKAVRVRE